MADEIFIFLLAVALFGTAAIAVYWLWPMRLRNARENRDLLMQLKEAKEKIQKQKQRIARLHADSRLDALTQLPDKHGFREELIRRSSEVARYNVSACILLVAVDDFESFEARHGKSVGDVVLQHLAETVRSQVRVCDFGACLSRGRFAVVLSHTGIDFARPVADRLRQSVEGVEFQKDSGSVTVSIGVAALSDDVSNSMSVAEEALARAQANRRNQVVISDKK